MKILKNIVRLLALASLSLSISPLTTAKATTVYNGLGTSGETTDTGTTSGGTADTGSSTTGDDTTTTDKEAQSTVTVNVLSGILTLDAVPDFSFGSMMIGSTAKLASNTVDTSDFNTDGSQGTLTAGKDGNSDGVLQMTDSRNTSGSDNMPGFTLTASMGKLHESELGNADNALTAILNLSAIPLVDNDNENVSNTESNLYTKDAAITSDTNTATVIQMEKGKYRPGIIKAKFNTPDSASLTIPKDGQTVTASKDPSAKKMNAVVTWTLSANPSVTTN